MTVPEEREESESSPGTRLPFLVVGIGASAGGLQAIESLLEHIGPDDQAAYVVITHQAVGQPSLLPELLSKRTALKVTQLDAPTPLVPGTIYLPPPGGFLHLEGRVLQVDVTPAGGRLPIDHFFRSLAREVGPNAVAIVLSGTGSDGTEGVRAVKGEAGLALAQDEASASHAGMPRSAVATGLVDFVLAPGAMGPVLRSYGARALAQDDEGELPEPLLQKVFVLLRQRTGHDFSSYKRKTLRRRIERRVLLHELPGLREYLQLLARKPEELEQLFRELLIGVTSFFRDPEAFQSLCRDGLPRLLADKPEGYEVRAWVAGCSTGEEAYSLSIALRECLDQLGRHMSAQVFATDINGRAIDLARAGLDPEGIAADVGAERLERFFTPHDGQYRIAKVARDAVVFAVQDVLKDPPFTKLDLISCRNVFIYLQPELQRRLLTMFHYALKPDGLLFLGSSESVGGDTLFTVVDKRWKLFRRRAAPGAGFPELPVQRLPADPAAAAAREAEVASVAGNADRLLLELYTPPSVLVTPSGDIVHVRGRTGPFLEPAQGQPHMNVLAMAREGLAPDLALALRRAAAEGKTVERRGVRVRTNGHWSKVDLVVRPASRPDLQGLLLVSFEETRVLEGGWAAWRAGPGGPLGGVGTGEAQEARDVMTTSPAFVSAEAGVLEAARAMRDQRVGALPVRDREGRFVGMITDRDITVRVTAEDKDPRRTLVHEVMSPELVVCEEHTALTAVARVMQDHGVRRVPIVKSGAAAASGDGPTEIVGIVSLDDLVTDLPAPALAPGPVGVQADRGAVD